MISTAAPPVGQTLDRNLQLPLRGSRGPLREHRQREEHAPFLSLGREDDAVTPGCRVDTDLVERPTEMPRRAKSRASNFAHPIQDRRGLGVRQTIDEARRACPQRRSDMNASASGSDDRLQPSYGTGLLRHLVRVQVAVGQERLGGRGSRRPYWPAASRTVHEPPGQLASRT